MKEAFVTKNFKPESYALIVEAEKICVRYAAQGYDLSLRQLYYQFIAVDFFPNTEENYKRLGSVISDARLAGLIDWDMIKDRGRETLTNSHWETPADILDSAAHSFRVDTWADQPYHVEVMVEKQALEGVLHPVCRELDIAFTANKGYSSSSALYEIGKRLGVHADDGKELHVIYLGDHDPSGIDMTRDVRERLELFSEAVVNVHRVALNMDQIEEYGPPENPAKMTDSRATDYVRKFGTSSWELDALEPSLLARIVTEMVADLRDIDLYNAARDKQDAWKRELQEAADKYREASN